MRKPTDTPEPPTLSDIRRAAAAARKTFSGGRNGGRPKLKKRCQCGAMSAKRAKSRGHKCSKPLDTIPAQGA